MKKWANWAQRIVPRNGHRAFSKKEVQMTKKLMKKTSPSLGIKEMQIQTTLRFHLTPVRMNTNRVGGGQGEK
jgi:hypothetical protein